MLIIEVKAFRELNQAPRLEDVLEIWLRVILPLGLDGFEWSATLTTLSCEQIPLYVRLVRMLTDGALVSLDALAKRNTPVLPWIEPGRPAFALLP